MKKTYNIGNEKSYDVHFNFVWSGTVDVEVYEVIHPERKFFRRRKMISIFTKLYLIDEFDSIDEILLDAVAQAIKKTQIEEERKQKIKSFLDKNN